MVGHGGSSAGSYLADPTSPIPSHCASVVATSTLRVNPPTLQVHWEYSTNYIGLPEYQSGKFPQTWWNTEQHTASKHHRSGNKKGTEPTELHKTAGPYYRICCILKELVDVISQVVTRIFRASLSQGKTPDTWREAHVTPVFKKGEKYKVVNYHPVSLTSILCKQMEHILPAISWSNCSKSVYCIWRLVGLIALCNLFFS